MTAKILQSGNILLLDKLTILYVILANYLPLLNIIFFMHTVLVIIRSRFYVSYGRYQIATLKSCVLLGGRA